MYVRRTPSLPAFARLTTSTTFAAMIGTKDVELSVIAKVLVGFSIVPMGPLTLFMLPLFMWWFLSTTYPRQLDERGMTMRNGARREWSDLVRATPTAASMSGIKLGGGARLDFADGSMVAIVPNMIADPDGVLGYISDRVGAKIVSG
jgi:hypothetical protein